MLGVGIPFGAKSKQYHQWVNNIRPVQDFKIFRDICEQTTSKLLMKNMGYVKKAQSQFVSHVPASAPRVFPYANW